MSDVVSLVENSYKARSNEKEKGSSQPPGKKASKSSSTTLINEYNRFNECFSYLYNASRVYRLYCESQKRILDEYRRTVNMLVDLYMGNIRSQIQSDMTKKADLVKAMGECFLQSDQETVVKRIEEILRNRNKTNTSLDMTEMNVDTLSRKLDHNVGSPTWGDV